MVINYGEGEGLQNGKIAGPKLFVRRGKTFRAPPFKEWKLFTHPYNMAKTSSYRIKTTPKLFVLSPPFSMTKKTSPPPPFRSGKTSRAPPPIL